MLHVTICSMSRFVERSHKSKKKQKKKQYNSSYCELGLPVISYPPLLTALQEGVATVGKVRNVVSPQYALLAKGTFHFTIYSLTFGKSKMADVDMFAS